MATHETLHDYYLHQLRNLTHYLKCSVDPMDAELVHNLRLSIKKLRALHILLGQFAENTEEEQFRLKKRIRKLYQIAGELRDTQVQIEMHSAYEQLSGIQYPEYRIWLLQREIKKRKQFHKAAPQASLSAEMLTGQKQVNKILANADSKSVLHNSRKVISELFKKAELLTSGNIDERSLHSVRKITKQLRYILGIIQHIYPDFRYKKLTVVALRAIEEEAGHWHDCLVRVEFLIKYNGKLSLRNHSVVNKYQKLLGQYNKEHDEVFAGVQMAVRNMYSRKKAPIVRHK